MKNIKYLFILLVLNFSFSICLAQMRVVNKFMPMDLQNDKTFVEYFQTFKLLVKNNDKHGLSKLMKNSYSNLHVSLDRLEGKKGETIYLSITNESDFLRYYPRLFDERMRKIIAKQEIKDLKLMERGIMLGRGQIWWRYYAKEKKISTSLITNENIIF